MFRNMVTHSMRHIGTRPERRLLTIAALTCLLIFCVWIISVLVPITVVELRYQYKKALADAFHVADIRGLIFPQFRLDLKGYTSTHTTNGISIPSVFIDEPVVFNIDPNDEGAYRIALKKGIAHASGTAFPGNPSGVGYYFAHSSTPGLARQLNAVFYLLDKVKIGDEVYIWHEGERHDYAVYAKQITAPDDISFLHRTYNTETIVLQTCWPPGTTNMRLLVFARRT